jgi:light-regulated signal transduction histidine kinase (bacteriophytochrome)
VISFAQLLEQDYQDRLDADARAYIDFIVDGATRMRQLIQDLLAFSRVGTRGKKFAPTDCEQVLQQVLRNLSIAISESDALVTHDPLPTVMADQSQLIQLFQNLISNAIKFRSDKPPRVHLSAVLNPVELDNLEGELNPKSNIQHPKSEEWRFCVRDNGIGIDPQYRDRIFAIFQRLHTRRQYQGTGIGLAICQKIIQRHGGRIWVESTLGQGSVFYFTIPAETR